MLPVHKLAVLISTKNYKIRLGSIYEYGYIICSREVIGEKFDNRLKTIYLQELQSTKKLDRCCLVVSEITTMTFIKF